MNIKYNPELAELIEQRGETAGTPLFDPLTIATPDQVSRPKFCHLSAQSNDEFPANTRKSQIMIVIQALSIMGVANDRMISEYTKIPRHLIPDRRGRLMSMGRIKLNKEAIDPVTHKKTAYWNVTAQGVL